MKLTFNFLLHKRNIINLH